MPPPARVVRSRRPVKPIFLELHLPVVGEVVFPAYMTMLMVGFLVAVWLARREEDRGGRDGTRLVDMGILMLVAGVLGARLLSVLADGKLVRVADIPPRALVEPTSPDVQEKHQQWESDRHVPLNAAFSSAELAYIALQTPVIMAVHASELLPDS